MSTFKVRDFRNKGFFLLDDVYLNGYAKLLGTTASMVYIYLCRCADKKQSSFPSQEIIAEKLGINERVVMRKIKELVEWNLISSVKTRGNKGTWRHNTYHLLDKSEWKQPPTQKVHLDEPPTQKVPKPPTQIMYIKDTHVKDTHIIHQHEADVDDKNNYLNRQEKVGLKGFSGASYEWQDYAARMWKNLGLKGSPSPSWFKLFRESVANNKRGLIDATYGAVADLSPDNPELYFYKVYKQKIDAT